MKLRLCLLTCTTLLSLSACKKEKDPLDTLPEATQTGAGSVGWIQGGKAFQPVNTGFNIKAIQVERYSTGRFLFAFKRVRDIHNRAIRFSIPGLRGTGTYQLNRVADPTFPRIAPDYGSFSTTTPEPSSEYLTSPAATGQLTVTRFDSVARIISGTFEFTAQKVRGEGPETVRITDGRFDVRYQP